MSQPVRTFQELPEQVVSFISDIDALQIVRAIAEKYHVADFAGEISNLIESVVLNEVEVAQLPDELLVFGVEQEQSKKMAIELAVARLIPISAVMEGLEDQLVAWGADPNSFKDIPRIHVSKPPVPEAPSPVAEALKDSGAVLSDPIMQHRLELVVSSFHSGVRTREQAIAVLMRSVKTGGLEMSEKAAGDVLAIAEKAKPEGIQINESATKLQNDKLIQIATNAGEGGVKGTDTLTEADEAEVKQIAEEKKHVIEAPRLITDTKAAAGEIMAGAKLVFATGELKTRFEHLIDARLRDVRDGFETRERLEASVENGGVGLSGAQLVTVMEMVENMDAMHHKALEAGMKEKKEQGIAQKAVKAEQVETAKQQEAQVMSKRYAEITGKAPTEHVEAISGVTTAAVSRTDLTTQREQTIDTAKVKAAIEASKAPAPTVTPVMSSATIPMTTTGRPKVEDIRFERKLAGPVEELQMLTLSDFRRLSKDPHQAALKVQDKVNIASHEGYNNRVAAIKAWRASPLSSSYIALSREALASGKGMSELLSEKRASGEEVMSDEELGVIVELNGVLRL